MLDASLSDAGSSAAIPFHFSVADLDDLRFFQEMTCFSMWGRQKIRLAVQAQVVELAHNVGPSHRCIDAIELTLPGKATIPYAYNSRDGYTASSILAIRRHGDIRILGCVPLGARAPSIQ